LLVLTCLTACVNGWRVLDGLRQQKGLKSAILNYQRTNAPKGLICAVRHIQGLHGWQG